jgi:tetratricopeptide (TPR) repeat protein
MAISIGTLLGSYKITALLGKGGMGEVYRADDRKLNREVAIKILPEEFSRDPARINRFEREAEVLASLNHRSIAAIYDLDEASGTRFLVLELIAGETLADRIARGPIPLKEAVAIATEIAEALEAAHDKAITHRDIKPANIMLTHRLHVKVLDFGLAKITHAGGQHLSVAPTAVTQNGSVIGTIHYMSPEQILGREVDSRSDLFSLGVVLFEMVTGHLPFEGVSLEETMARIINAEPNGIAVIQLKLANIIGKCLEKAPERRYANAGELLQALQGLDRTDEAVNQDVEPAVDKIIAGRARILRNRWSIGAAVFAMALAIIVVRWLEETPRVLSFQARDWVLVTDLTNQTGDPVFEKSLQTALLIGLEQSRYANVFPTARIAEALKRMNKTATEPINEVLGRQIALREGIRALIVPSISGVGESYQLAARIEDPTTGRSVRAEQIRATGKNKILPGVDDLVGKVRVDLGESLPALAETTKPLAKVTTSSLEALKLFSVGHEKHAASNFEEAKTDYENAIRIDPNFMSAKGTLGVLLFEKFDREEGKRLLSEVIQSVDGLTDQERYGISAFYAVAVENDLPKAIQLNKLLLALHPDNWNVYNNIGWYSFQLGKADDAIAAYKEAIRLNPYAMISYNGFAMVYLYLAGDIDAALDLCRKQISYDDTIAFAHENLAWALLGKGDSAAAEQSFQKALKLNEKSTDARYRLGHTYLLERRYREAADMYLSIPHYSPTEYYPYYYAGLACELGKDSACQHENLNRFVAQVSKRIKEKPNEPAFRLDFAKGLIRNGSAAEGQATARAAMQMAKDKHFEIAQLLGVQGKPDEAVSQLELAVQNGFHDYVSLKVHPDLQVLQNGPRFREFLNTHLKTGGSH